MDGIPLAVGVLLVLAALALIAKTGKQPSSDGKPQDEPDSEDMGV